MLNAVNVPPVTLTVATPAVLTVKSAALVAVVCPANSTVILPLVAPAGTEAVICVPPALTEEAAVVPLNFTTGDAPKLEPLIVTLVPTAPELGLNPLIVGPVPPPPALTVPLTAKSSPAVARLFRYQVPVELEPVTVTLKVTVVLAARFCKAEIPERMIAVWALPALLVVDPHVIAEPILTKVDPSRL